MRIAGIALLALMLFAATASGDDVTVYLSKTEALEHVFPEADRVVELRHLLTREEARDAEDCIGRRLKEGGFYIYAAYRDDRPIGYAVIVAEVGKIQPITHIVEVTPEGKAGDVAVMIYRETHGAEVADDRFMDQYVGMGLDDPIRINKDVINIAGATLSGHAICRGVRKALCVVKTVLLDRDADERAALLEGATPVIPAADPSAPEATLARAAAVEGLNHVVIERTVMGTLCRIDAWSGQPEDAVRAHIKAALDEVVRWDGVLSNWRDDTPLADLNASPVGEPVKVDANLMAWLIDSRRWSALTGGAFDPAVGSLVEVWGLNTGEPARPDESHLESARRASGLHLLEIDAASMSVTRTADVRLDPGASGKGFALDRAAGVLKVRGIKRALLSFRSTLLALDPPPGRSAWDIPVVHDGGGDGNAVTTVPLARGALSVSGGTFHAFVDRDVSRGHVIDPESGVPVEAGRLAWVRHPSAAAADALSTALLVRGILLPAVPLAQGGFLASVSSPPAPWPR